MKAYEDLNLDNLPPDQTEVEGIPVETLKQLREGQKSKKIYLYKNEEVVFVLRKPTREEMARFQNKAEKDPATAMNNLVLPCVIYPNRAEVLTTFDEYPGLPLLVGDRILALSTPSQNSELKKL